MNFCIEEEVFNCIDKVSAIQGKYSRRGQQWLAHPFAPLDVLLMGCEIHSFMQLTTQKQTLLSTKNETRSLGRKMVCQNAVRFVSNYSIAVLPCEWKTHFVVFTLKHQMTAHL